MMDFIQEQKTSEITAEPHPLRSKMLEYFAQATPEDIVNDLKNMRTIKYYSHNHKPPQNERETTRIHNTSH